MQALRSLTPATHTHTAHNHTQLTHNGIFPCQPHTQDRTVGKRFDRSLFLVAVYDPPYKPFDRHNEIWVLRKWKKCCKQDALRGGDDDDDCDDDCETCGGGDSPDTS